MCTAISYLNNDHYFGRNLDLERSFLETVTVTPQNYNFIFRTLPQMPNHYAMIGVSSVFDNYPLYYEATNEHGLSIAGLNFPGNAVYCNPDKNKVNLAPYELIPWLLGQYKNVRDVQDALPHINIIAEPFNDNLPLSPLHWMISDKQQSIVLETTNTGMHLYSNPVNVLTNNPPFSYHLYNLANYLNITREEPNNRLAPNLPLSPYSRGMGGLGLPGDLSSASRFIRAAFVLHNSASLPDEHSNVSQFFHILGSVEQQRGCVKVGNQYEQTIYSCCCNTDKGIYYYKTYNNSSISAVNLFRCDLSSSSLFTFPLKIEQTILYQN